MFNQHVEAETPFEQKVREGSDYHKAVFGYRPRGICLDDTERAAAWDIADRAMKKMKSTEAGRASLRHQGWVLEGDSYAS